MEWKKPVIAIICIVEMFFFTDTFYGFNSLSSTYKSLGVFSSICTNSSTTNQYGNLTVSIMNGYLTCDNQDSYFGYAFTVWMCFQAILAIPVGTLVDSLGIRKTKIIAAGFCAFACLFFALIQFNSWLLFFAGCLLSFASLATSISNVAISDIFNENKNLMINVQSGLMGASALVFSLIKLTYDVGIPLYASFGFLGGFAVVTNLASTFIQIRKRSKEMESYRLAQVDEDDVEEVHHSRTRFEEREEYLLKMYPTIWKAFFSRKYIMNVVFFSLNVYRFFFFLSQMGSQLTYLFPDNKEVVVHLQFVSNIFFFCGVVISVFSGLLIDYFQKQANKKGLALLSIEDWSKYLDTFLVIPLLICSVSIILPSVMVNIANKYVYYVIFMLLCIFRSFNSGLLGSYVSSMFPKKYLGKLIGGTILITGMLNLTQFPLINLATPDKYPRLINYLFIMCPILAAIHPISLHFLK